MHLIESMFISCSLFLVETMHRFVLYLYQASYICKVSSFLTFYSSSQTFDCYNLCLNSPEHLPAHHLKPNWSSGVLSYRSLLHFISCRSRKLWTFIKNWTHTEMIVCNRNKFIIIFPNCIKLKCMRSLLTNKAVVCHTTFPNKIISSWPNEAKLFSTILLF